MCSAQRRGVVAQDYAGRRGRLAEQLTMSGVDAALVTRPVDVGYLTGVVSSNAACLLRAEGTLLVATDARYADEAVAACPDAEVLIERQVAAALVRRMPEGAHRLGLQRDHVTLALADALTEAAEARTELVDLGDAITSLRARKDEVEVGLLTQACSISVHAFTGLLDGPIVGRTEREIARDLESRMLMAGADGLAFDTIVASGPNGAVPHHHPTERVVGPGDLVTIDFGATVGGYHADCTRTVAVAPIASWQHEIYHLVQAAQRVGVAALAPGASTASVDAAARAVIDAGGYADAFVHGLGHGVGLEIHEAPWLTSSTSTAGRLPSRTTVTVEPGIYLPGVGGVRIEDTTEVGPDGVRVLTDMTTALIDVTA